jgi:hypothetical protein
MRFEDLEIWDHIKGYEGRYKVSSKGRVWSIRRNKIMKPDLNKDGYYYLKLSKLKNTKHYPIHRLVAMTFYFVDNYENLQVDHIDRDKTNNYLLNLRFCTRAENCRNQAMQKTNKSGYKGVYQEPSNRWRAQITINNRKKHLGIFTKKEEAYEAYKKASKELHGEYGYTP